MPPANKKVIRYKGVSKIEDAHKTNLVYRGQSIYVHKYRIEPLRLLEQIGRIAVMEIRQHVSDYKSKEFALNILGPDLNTWCLSQDWMIFEDIPYMTEVMFDYLSDSKINLRELKVEYLQILVRDSSVSNQVVKVVGDDVHNDCLYVAILKTFNFNKDHLPRNCTTPEGLKKKLKLARNDKIPISKYPEVEQLYGIRIHQSGDYLYESNSTAKLHVYLHCKGEHVEMKKPPRDSARPTINFSDEKSKVVSIHIAETITIYDGESTKVITEEEHKKLSSDFNNILVKIDNVEKLVEEYDNYKTTAKALIRLTDGLINKFKSPYDSKLSFDLFRKFSRFMAEPSKLSTLEQTAIDGSFHGGVRYSNKGVYQNVYLYDVNKYYSHWLSSSNFLFPIDEPIYQKLNAKEFELMSQTNIKFGLYKVILKSNHKLFNYKINKSIWVTHHDLKVAKMLNVEYRIDENCINALLYEANTRVSGFTVFRDYFQKCGEWIEQADNFNVPKKSVKYVMNAVWGCMCAKKKVTKRVPIEEIIEIENHHLNHVEFNSNCTVVKLVDKKDVFKYNWARVSFITAYARYKMIETLLSFESLDDIVYVNTDGFISLKEQPSLKVSDKMGDWSCKHYEGCEVKNGNTVSFS